MNEKVTYKAVRLYTSAYPARRAEQIGCISFRGGNVEARSVVSVEGGWMKLSILISLYIGLSIAIGFGCGKKTLTESSDAGPLLTDYCPLNLGNWRSYKQVLA